MAAPAMPRPRPLPAVLLLLLLAVCAASAGSREPHVINGFKPAEVDPVAVPAPQPQPAHRVDAAPSDPVDVDEDGGVPGYGLNGAHGDLSPWLPSQPSWQLPGRPQDVMQVQQVQLQQAPQVQQVQQAPQMQQVQLHLQQAPQVQPQEQDANMMRVIHRPGSGPTPSAHYIVNRPPAGDRIDTLVDTAKPPPPPQKKPSGRPTAAGAPGTVSETDMYLLGAIEKLVYRVDFLEKRLRRTEELVYYLMEGAGNKQEQAAEPCPKDFTRAGRHCYHFSGRDLNWKSASSACKAMDSILVEIIDPADKRDLVNWATTHQEFRGRDFWTGGLNPGLLWIWANSARPVSSASAAAQQNTSSANAIKNPGGEDIPGNGRCLKLAYNPATRQYNYQGGDCSARFRFICQVEEPSASRALSRIHKSLNIRLDGDSSPPPPPAPVA